ncbi:hypothetical protein DPMN_167629 [Dreissena polymorpha]|uniref:Uncharacterized protein n=1 Tax=Dreissena polymorpha TaxID=45954 RepID=A0A9D4F182_DREPO|nr:hypothetical protein DPMN_167629 [Dreissena polymorpha]
MTLEQISIYLLLFADDAQNHDVLQRLPNFAKENLKLVNKTMLYSPRTKRSREGCLPADRMYTTSEWATSPAHSRDGEQELQARSRSLDRRANLDIKIAEAGDLTEHLALKARLQCRPFRWFLDNVWPELLIYKEYNTAWGYVVNVADDQHRCLDNNGYLYSVGRSVLAESCAHKLPSPDDATRKTATKQRFKPMLCCLLHIGWFAPRSSNSSPGRTWGT